MSNKISRRSFLKVSGASALALGAASMLGGCQSSSSNSVEVKVGDKISNWNNLAVQLTSVFTLADAPDVPGSKYVAILVTAVNRSKTDTMAIGAQNVLEIDAAYPLNTEELKAANTAPYFHALSASTTDFAVTVDGQTAEAGAYVALYDSATETFNDSPNLPPQGSGYIELVCIVPVNEPPTTEIYTLRFRQAPHLLDERFRPVEFLSSGGRNFVASGFLEPFLFSKNL